MIEKDALVEEVLSYINSARILAGYIPLNDLRKGKQNSPAFCPIARSFSDWIPVVAIEANDSFYDLAGELVAKAFKTEVKRYGWVYNPECFDEFIERFDEGDYPQYEEKEEK